MNRQQKGPDPSRPSPIRQHLGFYQVRPVDSRVSSSGPDMSSKRGLLFDAVQLGLTLAVLPVAQEDMPSRLREAITRRRIAAITGECPCGTIRDHRAPIRGRTRPGQHLARERLSSPARSVRSTVVLMAGIPSTSTS